jgi:hypothetical protein
MKLCLKYKNGLIKKHELEILKEFILLLQKEKPIKGDLSIEFLSKRKSDMTTGQFSKEKLRIRVLFKDRMLADVLRTLSHEWAHCYDHQNLKIKDRRDIGGKSEDYANKVSGELTKKFIRKNPKLHSKIFD